MAWIIGVAVALGSLLVVLGSVAAGGAAAGNKAVAVVAGRITKCETGNHQRGWEQQRARVVDSFTNEFGYTSYWVSVPTPDFGYPYRERFEAYFDDEDGEWIVVSELGWDSGIWSCMGSDSNVAKIWSHR